MTAGRDSAALETLFTVRPGRFGRYVHLLAKMPASPVQTTVGFPPVAVCGQETQDVPAHPSWKLCSSCRQHALRLMERGPRRVAA